ncbi:bifunctional sugar-1-phosphate nucleotidylyltransferase/acetyltransferase [Chloroflexota bacterium]
MKVIILAAGEGSRMRPLTYSRPKVMLPLANKPILEHSLIQVREAGIGEFIFVVGYCDEQVRNYFGNGEKWGVHIDYCAQRKQQGTADALERARDLIDGPCLMLNGDTVFNHEDIQCLTGMTGNTMSVVEAQETGELGVVELDKDRVIRIYEKAGEMSFTTANAGMYLFTPDIFDAISKTPKSPRGEYEITTTLQLKIDKGERISYHRIKSWLDFSYPWDMLDANESLIAESEVQSLGKVEDNVIIQGKVSVGQNTVIRSGSYIVGPVSIGQHCDIGPNCYIRPGTSIGDSCHIGSAVEIKNSIIMKGSKIPHQNYIGDSIIGEGCNFGAGAKVANLRLDRKNVEINNLDTKRRKLGAIVADGVQIGINACLNVGSVIGNNARIGPGAVASGTISPDSRIF